MVLGVVPAKEDETVRLRQLPDDAFMLSRANRPTSALTRCSCICPYIRGEASLPPKLQELVMISVAREMSCAFIWYAHAAAARQAGVRDDIVDNGGLHRELLQNRKVSRPTFDAACFL